MIKTDETLNPAQVYELKKLSDFFDKYPTLYRVRNNKRSGMEFQLITKASK